MPDDRPNKIWQPIKTAPKYPLDARGRGPRILAFGVMVRGAPVVCWDPKEPRVPAISVICWVELEYEADEPAGVVDGEPVFRKVKRKSCEYWGDNPQQFTPTHWMPLPEPPEDTNV